MTNERTATQQAFDALAVVAMTAHVRGYLMEKDPKAFSQVVGAANRLLAEKLAVKESATTLPDAPLLLEISDAEHVNRLTSAILATIGKPQLLGEPNVQEWPEREQNFAALYEKAMLNNVVSLNFSFVQEAARRARVICHANLIRRAKEGDKVVVRDEGNGQLLRGVLFKHQGQFYFKAKYENINLSPMDFVIVEIGRHVF